MAPSIPAAILAHVLFAGEDTGLRAIAASADRITFASAAGLGPVTVVVDHAGPSLVAARLISGLTALLAPARFREEELRLGLLLGGAMVRGRCVLGQQDHELLVQADVLADPERLRAEVALHLLLMRREVALAAPLFAAVGRGVRARTAVGDLGPAGIRADAAVAEAERIVGGQQ